MVLDKLSDSLKNTLEKIAKALFVDEKLVNELVRDVQRALLQSDVNVRLVFDLTEKIKKRALSEEAPSGLTKKEQLINIVYDELVNFLGKEQARIEINAKPFKIMLVGLFGSGKTTTTGKLARYFSKRGYKVALVGLDIHRPAAMEQIEQIGKQANVQVFLDKKLKDPIKIWKIFEDECKNYDVVIIDTAGRDALSHDLIEEIGAKQAVVDSYAEIEKTTRDILTRQAVVSSYLTNNLRISDRINQIKRATPQDVTFDDIAVDGNGLSLSGTTNSESGLANLIAGINQIADVESVTVAGIDFDQRQGNIKFKISVSITAPKT